MIASNEKKRFKLFFKKVTVVIIAIAMLLQPIPGITGSSVRSVEAAVLAGDYIDLQQASTELYVGSDWAGANATSSVTGSAIRLTVNNFGTKGSNEWGLQYMVKGLGLKSNTKYHVDFDITSTIDKDVFIKLDDTGLIAELIHLTAGQKYHYSKESKAGIPSADKQILYFAMARNGAEAENLSGVVDIENIKVTEVVASGEFIDLQKATTQLYVGSDWAGANATSSVTGSAITLTVNNFGTGNSNEWGLQYIVKDLALKENTKYLVEFDITSSIKKDVYIKLDDNGNFINKFIHLTAGEKYHYSDVNGPGVPSTSSPYFFFALGRTGSEAVNLSGTVTIENLKIKELKDSVVAADYTYDNQADLKANGYELVWADEFNGTDLDPNKWSFQIGTKDPNGGPDYWGNNEQEYYTNKNHTVADGKLVISAKKESMGDRSYTSTRIRTKTDANQTLFATRYGRIEARIKLPVQEGLWPAFWLLPVDSTYGSWAASGELDIMEAKGRIPDRVSGTAHYGLAWPNNTYYGKEKIFDATTDISGYHLYSIEWEPGKITWFVDDVPYYTTGNFWSKGTGNSENYAYGAPFDVPFYMVLNLAVGGNFDGQANLSNAKFPAEMAVDYVRVFKKSDAYYQKLENNLTAPETGKDTASFKTPAYQPTGVDGDYVKDTAYTTLKTVTEVKPEDTSWQFYVGDFDGAAAVLKDTIDGVTYAKAGVTKGGNQNYAVQLIKHFPFAKGYTYTISFDAKASSNRDFILKPSGDGDNGWTTYGSPKTISLTNTMTHYTHQFTMDKDSDPTARLEFDLGLATGDAWIGNVIVKKVDPVVVDNTDIFKNPDQNGGNHIYNGSFDQGTSRLSFWHTENVSVEVPGVINPVHNATTGDSGDFSHRAFLKANSSNARIYQKGVWLQQSDIYQLNLNLSSDKATKVSVMLTNKDGSKVYMKQAIDIAGTGIRNDYTVNFAMSKGVTDKEAVFALVLENGATVSVDNIRLIRTTNNNVAIDYTGVDVAPISTTSTGWMNNLNTTTVTPATNQNGVVTSQTITNSVNYMSMLYIPVSVKAGITYHLSFQAKSQYDNSVMVNIQEDNSWAVTLEQHLDMKAEKWQVYNYTINSTLTNGSNPIYLKFLLSGPDVKPGTFMVKNVAMTADVQKGAKDAPTDTVITKGSPVKSNDYILELKDGEYRTKFFECVEKPARKALIMVNGSALPDGSVKEGKIIIPASVIGTGDYRIELALDGYNSIMLSGTVAENGNPQSTPIPSGGSEGNNNPSHPKLEGSGTTGWDSITKSLKESKTGSRVIDMNGSTLVKQDVFEAIRGKDIEVTFNLGNGIEWTINGNDIPENAKLQDIDFKLSFNTDHIPAELVEALSGTSKLQFSLAHDGSFGFTVTLRLPLKEGKSGQKAYLFYYNPVTKKMELQSSSLIDEKGKVELEFKHASDYVILIRDESALKNEINKITITPGKKTLYCGGTKHKNVVIKTVLPKSITDAIGLGIYKVSITYSSSNPKVASVSKAGKVIAKKKGKTVITTLVTINGIKRKFKTTITVKKIDIK